MQYPVTFLENAEVAMETVLEDGCIVMATVSTRQRVDTTFATSTIEKSLNFPFCVYLYSCR